MLISMHPHSKNDNDKRQNRVCINLRLKTKLFFPQISRDMFTTLLRKCFSLYCVTPLPKVPFTICYETRKKNPLAHFAYMS